MAAPKSLEIDVCAVDDDNPNPTPHNVPAFGMTSCPNPVLFDTVPASKDRIVVVTTGLPARGKTHIARRVKNYLAFFHGVACENVNVADYRRERCGKHVPAAFFDDDNTEGREALSKAREAAMADVIRFVQAEDAFSKVVFYDGTNSTVTRRRWILEQLKGLGCKVLFIESVCRDEELLRANIMAVHAHSPDYVGVPLEQAIKDYGERISHFERFAQPLDSDGTEAHLSWIRVIDMRRYVVNNVHGYLQGRIVQLVMNLRSARHRFYLSRHGQSEYNTLGKIGGDSELTPEGRTYARKLGEYAEKKICRDEEGVEVPARLWTSGLLRTRQTAEFIPHPKITIQLPEPLGKTEWVQMRPRAWHNLDEIYAGVCDGMSYDEIKAKYPDEYEWRKKDKLAYRYPRGESYLDVCHRLEPIIMEMERCSEPLLIVAHQGILRIVYAYFMGLPREEAPYVSIPLNTVITLQPGTYTCEETRELLHTKHEVNSDGQLEPDAPGAAGPSAKEPPPMSPLLRKAAGGGLSFESYFVLGPRQLSSHDLDVPKSEQPWDDDPPPTEHRARGGARLSAPCLALWAGARSICVVAARCTCLSRTCVLFVRDLAQDWACLWQACSRAGTSHRHWVCAGGRASGSVAAGVQCLRAGAACAACLLS
eukprot:CAMPEP_0206010758 /NCGR_PEP_ID=MMETSP1464-20131121/12157_1 /ASSEMBLY_ACC=CAM_ASM_001124 /TAXON_ID=119497 /ORGANISM="Exanthemachrysis gayraliae, Strain RCC1523" /LENGTH=649 /DNA_ID=CAMNT_0053384393 /DNA_START=9 /DNA_END=1959 /DNA_ORIENTATION=-